MANTGWAHPHPQSQQAKDTPDVKDPTTTHTTRSLAYDQIQARPATDADAAWAGHQLDSEIEAETTLTPTTRRWYKPRTWFNLDTGESDTDTTWLYKSRITDAEKNRFNRHADKDNTHPRGFTANIIVFAIGVAAMALVPLMATQVKGGLFVTFTPTQWVIAAVVTVIVGILVYMLIATSGTGTRTKNLIATVFVTLALAEATTLITVTTISLIN